jgi:integrase
VGDREDSSRERNARVEKAGKRMSDFDLAIAYVASQLLTAGVQLGYVSRQLGHSDVSVTARHYARWAGGDAYRRPLEVREDEVPADLLSRVSEKSPPSVLG